MTIDNKIGESFISVVNLVKLIKPNNPWLEPSQGLIYIPTRIEAQNIELVLALVRRPTGLGLIRLKDSVLYGYQF